MGSPSETLDHSGVGSLNVENTSQVKEDRSRDNARRIASSLARGNLSLQNAWFMTPEEMEAKKKKFADYDFRIQPAR